MRRFNHLFPSTHPGPISQTGRRPHLPALLFRHCFTLLASCCLSLVAISSVHASNQIVDGTNAKGSAWSGQIRVLRTTYGPSGDRTFAVVGNGSNLVLYYTDDPETTSAWTAVGTVKSGSTHDSASMVWDQTNNALYVVYGREAPANNNDSDIFYKRVTDLNGSSCNDTSGNCDIGTERTALDGASGGTTYARPFVEICGDSGTSKVCVFGNKQSSGGSHDGFTVAAGTLNSDNPSWDSAYNVKTWTAAAAAGLLSVTRVNTNKLVAFYNTTADKLATRHDDSADAQATGGWDALDGTDNSQTVVSIDDDADELGGGNALGSTSSDVVWFGWMDPSNDVNTRRWSGSGLDTEMTVEAHFFSTIGPAFATDGATLWLFYQDDTDGEQIVYRTRSFSDGTTAWSATETSLELLANDALHPNATPLAVDYGISVLYTNATTHEVRHTLVALPEPPGVPTLHDIPFNNEKLADTTPDFEFTASDPDGTASIIYHVQIDDASDMSSPVVNCESDTSCAAGAGSFTNTVNGGDTNPFNEGERMRFTPSTTLTNNTTYYWRVRAEDDAGSGGSGTYGSWSTVRSFTVVTGTSPSQWFQTTDAQFSTGTLTGVQTTGSGSVQLSSASPGTLMSPEIDFDSVSGQNAWGDISFATTETNGDVKLKVYYTNSTACDTIVPNGALAGNSSGFDVSASPVNISGLNTGTYNRICLQANLTDSGGTPFLNDWTAAWNTGTTVSGIIYSDDGTTPYNCSSNNLTVTLKVDGAGSFSGTCTASSGAYSISSVTMAATDVVTVFVDDESVLANTVTRVAGAGGFSNFDLYQNRVIVRHEDAGPVTNADLDLFDNAGDPDMLFTVTGSNVVYENGAKLVVWAGDTYTPGGTVTTDVSTDGTDSVVDGDVLVQSSGTLSMGTNALSVGGDLVVSGSFAKSTGQTTTLTATASGFTVTPPATGGFENLTFNGASGAWAFSAGGSVDGNFTVTTGSVTAPSGTLTVGGNFTNSATFAHNNGTVAFNNAGLTSAITGATTFYNLSSTTGAKTLLFGASQTFTVNNTLTLTGSAGNLINIGRSGGSGTDRFAFVVGSAQSVSYVNVSNSEVSGTAGNDITASSALSIGGNTDVFEPSPHWIGLPDPANQYTSIDTFAASGTWTAPTGVTTATIEVWGAGGGGYDTPPTGGDGGGGGGGAYSRSTVSVSPGTGYSVVIGTSAADTDGGDSSFNGTTVVAKGGRSYTNGGGGASGTLGTGDVKYGGGNGSQGTGSRCGGGGAGDQGGGSSSTGGATNGGDCGSGNRPGTLIGGGGGKGFGSGFAGTRGEVRISYSTESAADFPVVKARSWGRTGDTTSHVLTMPSGIEAGDLLVILFGVDGNPTVSIASGGWTKINQASNSTNVTQAVFYKSAAGSDTATVSTTASESSAYIVLRIANGGTPEAAFANGSSTNANPPNLAPVAGSAKYLWLSGATWDWSTTTNSFDITAPPANFTNLLFQPGEGEIGAATAVAGYNLEASSLNPGTFTNTTEQHVASTVAVPAVNPTTISGIIYTDEGSTPYDCSANNLTVTLKVDGVGSNTGTCTASTGAYSISGVTTTAGDIVSVYIDGESVLANTVTRMAGSGGISNMNLHQDRVIVRHESGPITNADLDQFDNGGDPDMLFTVTSNNMTLENGAKLVVWAGDTYTPGGTVTTDVSTDGTDSVVDGDVLVQTGATLNIGSYALSVGGDFVNSGTFTKSGSQTTTFTATASGFTVTPGTGSFENVVFNGASGGWTLGANMTVNGTLDITNGTLDQGTGFNLVSGAVTVASGGVWTNTGTGDVTLSGNVANAGAITLNASGGAQCAADTDLISVTSSSSGTQRTWSGAGTFTIYDVNATDQAGTISVYSSTLVNTTWTNLSCGININGVLYSDEGVTPYDCSANNITVAVKVDGAGTSSYTCTSARGIYAVTLSGTPSAGQAVAIFLNGESIFANTITRAGTTTGSIFLPLYQNRVILHHADAGPIANVDIEKFHNPDDPDMLFTVTGSDVVYEDTAKVIVWTGSTYTPGGTVTTDIATSAGTQDGDLLVQSGATLSMAANVLSVGGDLEVFGTLSTSGTQTTTLTSQVAAAVTSANYYNLTFAPGAGTPTYTLGADKWYGPYQYRKPLVIQASQIPGTDALVDFPLLINHTDSDLAARALDSGNDIAFFDSSGVQLDHEIESFNGTSGALVAWVRMKSLSATSDTTIYVAYGKADDGALHHNKMDIWQAYAGVWHLKDDPSVSTDCRGGAGTLEACDASFDNSNGNSGGTMTSGDLVAGKIGNGIDFDGTDDNIDFGNTGALGITGAITMSAWVYVNNGGDFSGPRILSKSGGPNDRGWEINFEGTGTGAPYNIGCMQTNNASDDVSPIGACGDETELSDETWYHIVGVFEPGISERMYVNGSLVGENTAAPLSQFNSDNAVGIGYRPGSASGFLNAIIDEARVDRVARTGDWIAAEFNNQNTPASFYTPGSESSATPEIFSVSNDLTVSAGTVAGSLDVMVGGGDATGNGTVNLTGGTFQLDGAGALGGATAWTFNNLTLGDGTGTTTTTASGAGGFTVSGDLVVAANQTLDGTAGFTVNGGDVTGNGTINKIGGTFLVNTAGNFGGDTAWTFSSLTIGAAGNATTTATGSGGITVSSVLTIDTGDTLDAGSKTWTLSGSGTPFVRSGTLTPNASTFRYSGTTATNITAATYNHLSFIPAATVTYTLGTAGSQTITVNGNWTIGAGSNAVTATTATWAPTINVAGDLLISGGTNRLIGSGGGTITVNGSVTSTSTADSISLSGGTFIQRVASAKNFGPAQDTIWSFNALKFENSSGSPVTITSTNCGTGFLGVEGGLTVGNTGDTANTTLDVNTNDCSLQVDGGMTITTRGVLSASSAMDMEIYGGNWTNNGTFTANGGDVVFLNSVSSTLSGTLTGTSKFNNLIVDGAGITFSAAAEVGNNFTITTGSVTAPSSTLTIGGSYSNSGNFLDNNGTVIFNATTTGKTLSGQLTGASDDFYHLTFNGTGGGWSNTSALWVANNLTVTAGTLSGTSDITVKGGNATGDGVISLTGGTFMLDGTGNFGGDTGWTFSSLTFGDGTGAAVSTATGTGSITVAETLTVSANQTFQAGSKSWTLSDSTTCPCAPFVRAGGSSFSSQSSTFQYTGIGATNINSTTYNNLSLIPAGTPVYTLGTAITQTITTTGDFLIGNGTHGVQINHATYDPEIVLNGNLTIAANVGAFTKSDAATPAKFQFEPTGTKTWTDGTGVDIGHVVVANGASTPTIALGSSVVATRVTVNGSRTLDLNGSKTLTLTGSGTATSRPFILNGFLTPSSGTVAYTGTSTSEIQSTTYWNLSLIPAGTPVYRLGTATAETLNVDGDFLIGNGVNGVQVDHANFDPAINIAGNFTIAANAGTFTKSNLPATITFKPTGTKTWTDNTDQDIGVVVIGSGATTPKINLGSNVRATSVTINTGHELDANGSTVFTLTGTGTPFTITGTFTPRDGTVDYVNNNATTITAATYHHLRVLPNANGPTQTFGAGTFAIGGDLTLGNGVNGNTTRFDTNNPPVTVSGSVTIAANMILTASASAAFNVGTNWTNNGTFNHSNGTVSFNLTATSTITGATTFYNFVSTATGKTIKFGTGQTFTFASGGTLTLTGSSGNLITIDSDSGTSGSLSDRWVINKQGNSAVTYVNVADSGCDASTLRVDVSDGTSTNSGNNGWCWDFTPGVKTNTYTIGTRTANVNITGVSGGPLSWTVQLAAADLSNVAVNDKLMDEAASAKAWKITAVDDGADTVTVTDSEDNGGSPSSAGSTQAAISRWYTTTQGWEDARDNNLVNRDWLEKGEMYNDSTFTGTVTIDGSTTDATHYMWLTVPASQRHDGTAGTGVKIDPTGAGSPIVVQDGYTRVEWMEITGYTGGNAAGVNVGTAGASNSTIDSVIIHDYPDGAQDCYGIWVNGDAVNIVIKNSILYDGDHSGINVQGSSGSTQVYVYNTTAYNTGRAGISLNADTTGVAKNVISMGHSILDFETRGAPAGVFDASSNYNMSSDTSSPGANSLDSKTASNQFVSLTGGSEDFHLKAGNDARNAGTDLSASGVTVDIDGDSRPQSSAYDIGADEALAILITVSGTVYTNEGTTNIGANKTVRVKVEGLGNFADDTDGSGVYSINTVELGAPGDAVTVFLDDETEKAVTVTRAADTTSNISSLHLYQNRVIVRHEDAGPVTNADLDAFDNGGDPDLLFTVTDGRASFEDGAKLIVWSGKTFTPGGAVATDSSSDGTDSVVDGDLDIQSTATLSMGGHTLVVGGDFANSGTFSKSTGQSTVFTASAAGHTIVQGTGNFHDLDFAGGAGGWTLPASYTVENDLTIQSGTLTSSSGTLTVTGSLRNRGTFTHNSGTLLMNAGSAYKTFASGGSVFNNVTFNNASGEWTLEGDLTLAGDLTVTAGSLVGSANLTVNGGDITGNGSILLTGSAPLLYGLKEISASHGGVHVCAVSNAGKAYCWGESANGRLGDGQSTTDRSSPVRVLKGVATGADSDGTNLINIKTISAGSQYACAVSNAGNTYCWGRASSYRLGNNLTAPDQTAPVFVLDGAAIGADTDGTNLINIKEISAGVASTCAISNSGKTYCWGSPLNGELGDGQTTNYGQTPVLVLAGEAVGVDSDGTNLVNMKTIVAHSNVACAASNSGRAYCWGLAGNGGLGDGQTAVNRTTPVLVHDGEAVGVDTDGTYLNNVKSIVLGTGYTCALSNSGKTYCWGMAGEGRLGNGLTSPNQSSPVLVQDGAATGADTDGTNLVNIRALALGDNHSCAVSNSGKTYCWGGAGNGQLGNNSTSPSQTTPILVQDGVAVAPDADGTNLVNMKSITAGSGYTCAIAASGRTYCWGAVASGQLGDGQTTTDQLTPILVLKGSAVEDPTALLDEGGNFGGDTAWMFNNLTFGNGSGATTTTSTGTGGMTVTSVLGVATAQTWIAGSKTWTLTGTGNPFFIDGTFDRGTSTFEFKGNGSVNVPSASYFHVVVAPTADGHTYDVRGTGYRNLTMGNGTNTVTVDHSAQTLSVGGNILINNGVTYINADINFGSSTGSPTTITDLTASKQDLGGVTIPSFATAAAHADSSLKMTSLTIAGGEEFSLNGSNTLTLTGNGTPFTPTGTFTASTGTVHFNGTGTQTIVGNTSFYNLQATATAARTLEFTAGTTQTILSGGSVTFTGTDGNLLTLASTTPGTEWNLQADNAIASQSIQYVSVSDSNAGPFGTYAEMVAADGTSTDGGNNTNWDFGKKSLGFLEYF